MKKLLLAVFAVVFVNSLCFAQQASTPVSQAAQASTMRTVTTSAKVDSTIIGDSTKGIKSQLVIVGGYGNKVSLSVSDETSIVDKDGKMITVSDLKKGDRATVVYAVGKRVNRAQSVKLVE